MAGQDLEIPSLFLRSGQWEVGKNNKNLLSLIGVVLAKRGKYTLRQLLPKKS
ncbi:hypothetical protein G9F72_007255 [Clostridium estertheticum]|uniref:hypothetical protein n=1 Tax=Clostridium estertheticum TaxID=238834 RepID=UPI001CD05086|nr:hypothetical protein [Clostridium estertheticum]MBZ9686129.1 hypothetical protein [Clostridium estertheticum]